MNLDAHQHFWQYDPVQYPWIQPDWPLRRDFLASDLEPLLRANGFEGCIAVQARQTLEESRWLLRLADTSPAIKGVVGWADLRSDALGRQLEELTRHPKFRGVRHVVQDEPDDRFMLRPDFLRGISQLEAFGLAYDILIFPRQLPSAIELVRMFPRQRFVLDHLAKPSIKDQILEPWRSQIIELAQSPNVFCKVSGLVTEANRRGWTQPDFVPYLDAVWDAFGPDRIMFGSDWPVCLLAGEYRAVFSIIDQFLASVPLEAKSAVLGGTCALFYQV